VISLLLGICGCAGTAPVMKEAQELTIDLRRPTIAIAPGSEYTRVADGVSITISPTEFADATLVRRSMLEKSSFFIVNDLVTWEITDTPVIVHDPLNLEFTIQIQNNLDHVLRFVETVVAVSIDGKPYPAHGVEDLQRTILVPNQGWEGMVTGPERGYMPDDCNIVFSIYDVVTEVDEANNPTKRTNFEWIFTYNTVAEQRVVEVKRYEQKMTRAQAAAFAQGSNVFRP